MADIRNYIKTHILYPLKQYPTVIQDTMFEIITDKLEQLYEYTWRFPSIVTPDKNRLDILKAIADQFLFTIRDEADIQEQVDILDKILYVYNRRGSIDTIENMWKYYGGDLPKEVKVVIPSYNLFRYSISALSGTHSFLKGRDNNGTTESVDRTANTPGVYEIRLYNNTYPIPDLREFLLKELVAAGNEIYFTNAVNMQIGKNYMDSNPYKFTVQYDNFLNLQLGVLKSTTSGLTLSGNRHQSLSTPDDLSSWSGGGSILLEKTNLTYLGTIDLSNKYLEYILASTIIPTISEVVYSTKVRTYESKTLFSFIESRLSVDPLGVWSHKPGSRDPVENYLGYFIIGDTNLGEIRTGMEVAS